MATITIFGSSDDLLEVEGAVTWVDWVERSPVEGEPAPPLGENGVGLFPVDTIKDYSAVFQVGNTSGPVLRVNAYFDGRWNFGVSFGVDMTDETIHDDKLFPDWPIRISAHPNIPYSLRVSIDLPESAAHVARLQ